MSVLLIAAWTFGGIAVLAAIGVLYVIFVYVFAFWYAPNCLFAGNPLSAPYAGQKPPPKLFASILCEAVSCFLVAFTWPLGPFVACYYAPRRARGRPIVLVHGMMTNGAAFLYLVMRLRRRGILRPFYALRYNMCSCIDPAGQRLAALVERIAKPGETVDIVCHSWGGNVARWYIGEGGGAARVTRLIEMAVPNHGTYTGRYTWPLLPCPSWQVRVGSPVLEQLGPPPAGLSFTAIWSTCDEICVPPQLSKLRPYRWRLDDGTRRTAEDGEGTTEEVGFDNIGHLTQLVAKEVAEVVAARLRS